MAIPLTLAGLLRRFAPRTDRNSIRTHPHRPAWLVLAAFLSPAVLSLAAADAPAPAATHKEYSMFVGADISLIKDKEALPVVYAQGRILSVKVADGLKKFHIRDVSNLRATPNLKLSRSFVKISRFKSEQAFSPANDPLGGWSRSIALSDELAIGAQNLLNPGFNPLEESRLNPIDLTDRSLPGAASAPPPPPPTWVPPSAAQISPSNYHEMRRSSEEQPDKSFFDAMRVGFELTADKPVPDPYLVIITDITDPARPNEIFRWFYIESLDTITARPQKVRVLEAGFPFGFKVLNTTVHIYSRGQEVATSLAENRMEMSRDETHEFLTIQHQIAHKNATLPPSICLAELPAGFRAKVTPHQLKQVISVTVDAAGKVAGLAPDPAGEPLDPFIENTVRDFRFNPALDNGKPTTGSLTLVLADLVR